MYKINYNEHLNGLGLLRHQLMIKIAIKFTIYCYNFFYLII